MHILVAVDRSTESQNALVNALDVVDALGGRVTAVHVVADDEERPDAGNPVLDSAEERAASRDVTIETSLLPGDPIEAIAGYAETNCVDAIYVGHRGLASEDAELSGDRRGPLGSVSKGLVQRTKVPVTVFDRGL